MRWGYHPGEATGRRDPASGASASFDPARVSVLVVSDNERTRRGLTETLTGWGCRVRPAADGKEALELLGADGETDLVIADLQMPGMDGFAFVEALRRERSRRGPRITLLVSAGLRGDVDRCRELGIDAYLTKPVREPDLRETIRLVMGRPAAGPEVVTRFTLLERRSRLHVLVADGAGGRSRQLARLLERLGHIVDIAPDSDAAARSLREHPFDLAFVDTAACRAGDAARPKARILHPDTPLPLAAMMVRALQNEKERPEVQASLPLSLDRPPV